MDFAAIADAGLTGVVVIMLYFQSKKDKMFNDTIADHNRILEEHFKLDREDRQNETDDKIILATALKGFGPTKT